MSAVKLIFSRFVWGRPQTTADRDMATLERVREDSRWRAFDEPTCHRGVNLARERMNRVRREVLREFRRG